MFATGVTMGLAEWIIDDTCLHYFVHTYMYLRKDNYSIGFEKMCTLVLGEERVKNLHQVQIIYYFEEKCPDRKLCLINPPWKKISKEIKFHFINIVLKSCFFIEVHWEF